MKRFNFFLPEDLVDELKTLAQTRKTTLSEVIRQALLTYSDKQHGRAAAN